MEGKEAGQCKDLAYSSEASLLVEVDDQRFEVVQYDAAGSKLEGICRLCPWSRFARTVSELGSVYRYHFEEIHNAGDPLERFHLSLSSPSTSSWAHH